MAKPTDQSNRILLFTMGTIVVIAACIGWFNYQQQIELFKEKELFKLDCIANAVGYKLDAKEHRRLLQEFPDSTAVDALAKDPVYMEYRMILAQAVKMKKLSSQMYTLIYDSTENHFVFGLNSDKQPLWGFSYDSYPQELLELYNTGGVLDMYEDDNGTWLSAVYPLMDMEGNVVAALQVDEKFDIYQMRARNKVLFNVILSLIIIFIIGTLMFFSVRHLLTRQKRIAQERQEVENLRKELLANISHDLRTPLASIQGYLETILMKDDTLEPERRTQFLNTSLAGTVRLRTLVDELFELSKLEAKETQLHAEPINLIDLIHDVVAVHRGTAQTQQVQVHTHISEDLGLVNGDTKLVDRVLNNIIGNAIKYCNPGDRVDIAATSIEGGVEVVIEDTGAGIPAEDLPHIFDRFRRGKTEKSGSGLGLAIVRRILDLHGAEYALKSMEGQGTTFSFILPCWKAAASE